MARTETGTHRIGDVNPGASAEPLPRDRRPRPMARPEHHPLGARISRPSADGEERFRPWLADLISNSQGAEVGVRISPRAGFVRSSERSAVVTGPMCWCRPECCSTMSPPKTPTNRTASHIVTIERPAHKAGARTHERDEGRGWSSA